MMDALLILNQAMDAAGMKPDADPELLPERIREIRFVGNTFVAETGGLKPVDAVAAFLLATTSPSDGREGATP
jgi:hypothetical protein